jgi:hypothetical protein
MFLQLKQGVKYMAMRMYRHGSIQFAELVPDSISSPVRLAGPTNRTRCFLAALASYFTTCEQALQFFRRPKLVVSISQRSNPMDGKDLGKELGVEIKSTQICLYQGLMVKAERVTIRNLVPKAWLDGEGPYLLSWARPQKTYELPTKKLTLTPSPKDIDLIPEEEAQLPIWYATTPIPTGPEKDASVEVTLNTDPIIRFQLNRLKEPYIDIKLQFIAENYTDKKARKFRLNAKSWDGLCLTGGQ